MLPDLPIRPALPRIAEALSAHGTTVLVAPPGTGKTTLVPLALPGRVVVAEPRRLATRAAAARMAALLGEPVGRTVGYSVRGDRKVSADTRVEVVTSGLLVRRLQSDPELSGVDTVLLDECHERHLDADLLLTLLLDARDGLRPDLRLLATSATVAEDRLADLLGGAPVIRVEARTFPVETRYVPALRDERLEGHVARTIRTALSEVEGDVLAFLPGAAEIRRTADALRGVDADVVALHGRLAAADQDRALTPGGRRRVVLATAIAESSLTVPGVRAVVDSGRSRVPRVDHRRGMSGLVTVRTPMAVADQRAGRAGREAPGRVYRCWPEHEHSTLPRYPEPEIRTADLTGLALDLARWGTPDGEGLRWWDAPPPGPLAAARATLTDLGAVAGGSVTERGHAIARLGLHPRLARALLDGAADVGADNAAAVVALLDDSASATAVDLAAALRAHPRHEAKRLAALVRKGTSPKQPDPALVAALAYPERVARRRAKGGRVYLMAGGTAAELPPDSGLGDPEWLAIAVVDRTPGSPHGRIRLAARADEDLATRVAAPLLSEGDEVVWDGDVVARHVRRLGAITLTERPLRNAPTESVHAALREGLRRNGLALLRPSEAATYLRHRLALLHRVLGAPWPDVSDEALVDLADHWLGNARNKADLARIDLVSALRSLLPWPDAARLDDLVPERLRAPSGVSARVDYSADPPVLALKVQAAFGWTTSPTVVDGRVPLVLHLLSPAGRTAAITGDLESFWTTGYPGVRADLRGRYPKHKWPENPLED